MSDYMIQETSGPVGVRYRGIVVAIHWIAAALIITQIWLGFSFEDYPRGSDMRSLLFSWHKTLGVAVLLLGVLRLALRLVNPPPPYPQDFPKWERAVAVWTHRLFYVLIIGLPSLAALVFGDPFHWTVPELKGFNFRGGWVLIPELMALTLALTVYTAAFIAEIVRSGIKAVSHGQTEAARSLGLPAGKTLRLVIVPQALRVIIPPLTSQYLNIVKNSSLAAGIGYPDMVSLFAGTTLNQTGQAIEVIAITMSVYLAISISISILMNWYNKRIALIER